ncbi:dUTP diphosphatase [Alicyclobacillus acidoterrestris]|uniref:dUTP diphosphatase n=1 Tax=Alicyclobacillus acidoterrestris (strain ATCC 49025 / DSM 3922 / CIP 106132 / NCIMB 13137 / GD3B) TaxID=1356854 RepID=T0D7Z6_ALIAG|nr:dUTP diphosphatase [Alicyclobacillus acidoterrestris]EPZ47612.1 hypothetical protein N007_05710 [Alicyclobacillus acidoterrestris ATCC 49025]UNO47944.1 dUTP diphosphatase [Alicyclobacillus acidoterrestris]
MEVKVKRLHPDAVIPQYAHESGDSGFDLYALEDVIIEPGQTVKVRTGLVFEIPEGYELQIRPRSGVSAKTKLRVSNTPGTVDASFRGEVMVLVDNIKPCVQSGLQYNIKEEVVNWDDNYAPDSYIIRKGDRIAQAVIVPVIRAELVEVDELGTTERGEGGFGSSGTR